MSIMAVQKKSVAIIPPQMKYDKQIRVEQKTLRVAAYCRVSTLLEQQEGSYEAQVDYYTNKINSNPNWKCAGIFADDGKSATQTNKRDDFNAMIDACLVGKIDLVLTKSVSRFARNTVDALQNIRKLKEKGIPVIFEKEGVNTMESGGELLITILSSQAQEESRNISENTRWGVTRRFENGIVQVNHKKFLGYTKDEDGNLVVVPEEAVIVKRIFREYLEGKSIINIARGLDADGILTVTGLDHWHPGTIDKMLSNEKFCGDACMQKTYTVDFLTKKKVKNDGYVRQYYIEDNHEAIIPKELFHQVQEEKLRRASLHKSSVTRKKNKEEKEKSKYSSKYILTDLMVCAECGHAYRRQIWSKYGDKSAVWRCEDRLKQGKKSRCQHSPTLKEEQLHDAIMTAINSVVENTGEFIGTFRENVIRVIGNYSTQGVTTEYDEQIEKLQQQMLTLIENNAKQGAVSEDFDTEYKQLSEQINGLKTARIQMVQAKKKAESYKERVEQLDKTITTVNPQVREFDQDLVKRLISSIKVHKNMKLEIQFHSGIVIKQEVDYYE
ncbi:recombinase family protein [Faecalispora anaeroviscerum]|uniref:recombinase family protein n=1 Tax=Faecalispora anaeroviscerum TaxID=2991836 RepID=UPI0038CC1C83